MKIVIIPGFTGYPEEITFSVLETTFKSLGHEVIKIAWPYFPDNLNKYSLTETLTHSRNILDEINDGLVILGFSMGGIIATILATEYSPKKLGLIVTPYQAGSEDDLVGKYREWKETGFRELVSSKYGGLRVPFSFIDDAKKYNALDHISKVGCPKLFVVGEADESVPMSATRRLYDKAYDPKLWCQIPNMVHKYQYQQGMTEIVNEIIVDFIESDGII